MSAQRLLFAQLIVAVLLNIVQRVGLYYFSVDPNNGFFALSHFLGGVWIALFIAWGYASFEKRFYPVIAVLAAFGVGLCWEYFEVAAGMTFVDAPRYMTDTISDIVMDTVGGAFVAFVALKGGFFRKQ